MTEPIQKPGGTSNDQRSSASPQEATLPKSVHGNSSQAIISYFRLVIGDRNFDQKKGEIIGTPYISFNTGQHDLAVIPLDDPADKIRLSLDLQSVARVYIGFDDDFEVEMMVGTIAKFGRRMPDTTIIYIEDFSGIGVSSTPLVDSATLRTTHDDPTGEAPDQGDRLGNIELYSKLNQSAGKSTDLAETTAKKRELKYSSTSKIVTDKQGEIVFGQTDISAASSEASKIGDEIVSEGQTIKRVSPDGDGESLLTIDWVENRSCFIGCPTSIRRNQDRAAGNGGSWKVEGWDIDSKTSVGALVVVPPKNDFNPDKRVTLVDRTIRLGEPIFENSLYVWGDATLGGKRLPQNTTIVERIVAVARTLDRLNRHHDPHQKWQILSWYNPDGKNRHQHGDGVSFFPVRPDKVHAELEPSFPGGLALYPSRFIYLDLRHESGLPKLRFDF